jgi:hypothetical protein
MIRVMLLIFSLFNCFAESQTDVNAFKGTWKFEKFSCRKDALPDNIHTPFGMEMGFDDNNFHLKVSAPPCVLLIDGTFSVEADNLVMKSSGSKTNCPTVFPDMDQAKEDTNSFRFEKAAAGDEFLVLPNDEFSCPDGKAADMYLAKAITIK